MNEFEIIVSQKFHEQRGKIETLETALGNAGLPVHSVFLSGLRPDIAPADFEIGFDPQEQLPTIDDYKAIIAIIEQVFGIELGSITLRLHGYTGMVNEVPTPEELKQIGKIFSEEVIASNINLQYIYIRDAIKCLMQSDKRFIQVSEQQMRKQKMFDAILSGIDTDISMPHEDLGFGTIPDSPHGELYMYAQENWERGFEFAIGHKPEYNAIHIPEYIGCPATENEYSIYRKAYVHGKAEGEKALVAWEKACASVFGYPKIRAHY